MRSRRRCAVLLPALILGAGAGAHGAEAPSFGAPVLKWQRGGCFASWCQTGWYSSPAVADLNGDGQPDVIWGAYDVVSLNGSQAALPWGPPSGPHRCPGEA